MLNSYSKCQNRIWHFDWDESRSIIPFRQNAFASTPPLCWAFRTPLRFAATRGLKPGTDPLCTVWTRSPSVPQPGPQGAAALRAPPAGAAGDQRGAGPGAPLRPPPPSPPPRSPPDAPRETLLCLPPTSHSGGSGSVFVFQVWTMLGGTGRPMSTEGPCSRGKVNSKKNGSPLPPL